MLRNIVDSKCHKCYNIGDNLTMVIANIFLIGKVMRMKIIYTRQSVDKKDSISIENQIEFCKNQILPDNTEEVKIFSDKGFSGKNTNRPGFEEMISLIKQKIVSQVIVYKLDRVSRSLLDFAEMMKIFSEYNVDFISATEKFDTSTPTGRAMISIIMVFAQLERETIQQRITDNYYARGKVGMYLGGTAPYGFIKVKTTLNGKNTSTFKPNPDNINHLISMFNDYAYTSKSLGEIAKELNDNNIKSSRGAPWDNSKISRILRNPVYVKADADIYHYYKQRGCIFENEIEDYCGIKGCFLYGKRAGNERKYTDVSQHKISVALHDGVIDSRTFLMCQDKLDKNKQIKRTGAGKSSWLSGLIKCAYCGYSMTITLAYVSKERGSVKKIVCSGRKLHISCDRKTLSFDLETIESYIESQIKDKIRSLSNICMDESEINSNNKHLENTYKIEISKIDDKINNLINALADGNELTSKYINDKIKELDKEKLEYINKMNELKLNSISPTKIVEVSTLASKWDELDIEEKKTIAKFFIKRILFYDDSINVEWNNIV